MSPRARALVAVVAAAALAGCGGGGGDSAGGGGQGSGGTSGDMSGGTTGAASGGAVDAIDIQDFAYKPDKATAKVGQKITWTNQDGAKHDVDFTDKSFESELVGKGGTITFTPKKAGTFDYFCSVHQYMKGTLTVS